MVHNFILILACTSIAFIFCLTFMPRIISLAIKKEWFDPVDNRKLHSKPTPRLGGVGISLSFFITILAFPWLLSVFLSSPKYLDYYSIKYFLILVSFLIIHLIGLIDDFMIIKARYKLIFQIIAAFVAMAGGALIKSFTIPFVWYTIDFGLFAYPITLLWFVGVCNALNLIDGMDGLAGTISLFATFFIGLTAIINHQYPIAVISFALMGSLLGFLKFNLPPAKTFMGDSGSLFLGQILSVTSLLASPASNASYRLYVPVALLLVPILDVFSAIIRRKRKGISFATPDKEHLHHKLLDLGLSPKTILLIIGSLGILNGAACLFWEIIPKNTGIYFLLFNLLLVFGFYIFVTIKFHKNKKIEASELTEESL